MELCSHCGRQLKAHIRWNKGISKGPLTRRVLKGYRHSMATCPWYRIVDPIRTQYFDALHRASEFRKVFDGVH